ncbi:MAG: response regulator receiver protein [Spirosomataceae bacterium]
MDAKTEILVVGNHEKIMEILIRHINYNEKWNATPAKTIEEAKAVFEQKAFDIVLLSSGFDESIEQQLAAYFESIKPNIEVVPHYGGGTGLLQNEIYAAVERIKQK